MINRSIRGALMFNNKHYWQVNREERFYCSLLAHALLGSAQVRQDFSHLVQNKIRLSLPNTDWEVYIEATVLRDFWHDLGDPYGYSDETHQKRREVLEAILNIYKISPSTLDEHDLFWTTKQKKKLWSPGKWNERAIKEAGVEDLIHVKRAFNAKPDIMIVSGSTVLLIEAKVESGEGREGDSGYQQYEIQKLVARLYKLLVPQYTDVKNAVLALETTDGITWQEVVPIIEKSEIDCFTKQCLAQLRRY